MNVIGIWASGVLYLQWALFLCEGARVRYVLKGAVSLMHGINIYEAQIDLKKKYKKTLFRLYEYSSGILHTCEVILLSCLHDSRTRIIKHGKWCRGHVRGTR